MKIFFLNIEQKFNIIILNIILFMIYNKNFYYLIKKNIIKKIKKKNF
jgi:hypothetical protein